MRDDQKEYIAENALKILGVVGFDMECYTHNTKKYVYVYIKPWNRCYPSERTEYLHKNIRADYSGDELLGIEVQVTGE